MLELVGISLEIARPKSDPLAILNHVGFIAPAGHLMAVLGPTQSGKSTLLSILSGTQTATRGVIVWHGRDITKNPLHINDVGFVPREDDVLHGSLTVQENIVSAMLLRLRDLTKEDIINRVSRLMILTGIELISSQRASTLSLPQIRRLKLALALVSDPLLLICDEFTDGLDTKSERELVALLQSISRENPKRIVINATQNMSSLSAYDAVLVMNEGNVCFHGPARALPHYFSVKQLDEVFSRMAKRPASRWGESWHKHRDTYYTAFKLGGDTETLAAPTDEDDIASKTSEDSDDDTIPRSFATSGSDSVRAAPHLPSFSAQVKHLFRRRWTTFRRNRSEWVSQALLLVGLPLLAVLLMWRTKSHWIASPETNPILSAHSVSMAVLVLSIWVILVATLTSSAEIARERAIFERERQGGLRGSSYLLGKFLFLIPILLAHGAWLSLFVDMATGGLPGHALVRLGLLIVSAIAFSALCLGISAQSKNADSAQKFCLWLALLQIPLSGALLAWPAQLGGVMHPLISLHSCWSGSLSTLQQSGFAEAFAKINGTQLQQAGMAFGILGIHFLIGITVAFLGLKTPASQTKN